VTVRSPRIYLDTSVPNFVFADDAPDFRGATIEFFQHHADDNDLFVSVVVLQEIAQCSDAAHGRQLRRVLVDHGVQLLPEDGTGEVRELAEAFLSAGAVPATKNADALHLAYATYYEMDILLSWNFRHLANVRREAKVEAVKGALGYRHPLRLVSPLEVLDEDGEA